MEDEKSVLVVFCKCGKSVIQAGNPKTNRTLKEKRELGELMTSGHSVKTMPLSEYLTLPWYCEKDDKTIEGCTEPLNR